MVITIKSKTQKPLFVLEIGRSIEPNPQREPNFMPNELSRAAHVCVYSEKDAILVLFGAETSDKQLFVHLQAVFSRMPRLALPNRFRLVVVALIFP